jgi:hypothetical protein
MSGRPTAQSCIIICRLLETPRRLRQLAHETYEGMRSVDSFTTRFIRVDGMTAMKGDVSGGKQEMEDAIQS